MINLLWERGERAATIRLEHLWHTLCLAQGFSRLCAYPRQDFVGDPSGALRELCATHSQVFVE